MFGTDWVTGERGGGRRGNFGNEREHVVYTVTVVFCTRSRDETPRSGRVRQKSAVPCGGPRDVPYTGAAKRSRFTVDEKGVAGLLQMCIIYVCAPVSRPDRRARNYQRRRRRRGRGRVRVLWRSRPERNVQEAPGRDRYAVCTAALWRRGIIVVCAPPVVGGVRCVRMHARRRDVHRRDLVTR